MLANYMKFSQQSKHFYSEYYGKFVCITLLQFLQSFVLYMVSKRSYWKQNSHSPLRVLMVSDNTARKWREIVINLWLHSVICAALFPCYLFKPIEVIYHRKGFFLAICINSSEAEFLKTKIGQETLKSEVQNYFNDAKIRGSCRFHGILAQRKFFCSNCNGTMVLEITYRFQ